MYNLCINPVRSNNISFKGINIAGSEKALAKTIEKSLKTLCSRSEREVAEYDYFKPVLETFDNPDVALYVGEVKFKISQIPRDAGSKYKTQRSLEAVVYSPTKGQNVSRVISQGTKKQILDKLNDEKLTTNVETFIKDSSSMLIEDSY